MSISQIIREMRLKKGISQKELAAKLHVHQTAVSQWENGRTSPDNELLSKIADVFDISVDYLLGRENAELSSPTDLYVKIPVLGEVQAGLPMEAIENILDYEEINFALSTTGEYFGLQIRGSSMEPRMIEGDVVIVRKQEDAESGDTVVVLVNGDDATVKKLKKMPDGIMLIPNNPAFEPLYYSAKEINELPVRIIGKVVELRAKF
ncbi:MAG: LexA family protein [Candidatus Spyradocola sp.]